MQLKDYPPVVQTFIRASHELAQELIHGKEGVTPIEHQFVSKYSELLDHFTSESKKAEGDLNGNEENGDNHSSSKGNESGIGDDKGKRLESGKE